MTVAALQKLARWIAKDGALGRRSFLESCAGIVAGGMTMQGSSAFAQPANAVRALLSGIPAPDGPDQRRNDQCAGRRQRPSAPAPARLPADSCGVAQDRSGARDGLYGRNARSARLRRQQQTCRAGRNTSTIQSVRSPWIRSS